MFEVPQIRTGYGMYNAIMTNRNLLKVGLIGTIVAAICCFTPVLVVILGAVGLSALVGSLDYVLMPALVIFIVITVFALWKSKTASSN